MLHFIFGRVDLIWAGLDLIGADFCLIWADFYLIWAFGFYLSTLKNRSKILKISFVFRGDHISRRIDFCGTSDREN